MTVVNAENYYQEHFFKGTHRNLKELPGFGGDDGKAVVFADQYAGANMGEKIQAAITDLGATGGKIIVVPGVHVTTAKIEANQADVTTEFLKGATLTANGNFPAFEVSANRNKFVNPKLNGSNALNALNMGINILAGVDDTEIYGGEIKEFYRPLYVHPTGTSGTFVLNTVFTDSQYAAFVGGGYSADPFGTILVGVKAQGGRQGFSLVRDVLAIGCMAYNCSDYGFAAFEGNVLLNGVYAEACGTFGILLQPQNGNYTSTALGCYIRNCNRGIGIRANASGANWSYVTVSNNIVEDNATYGIGADTDDAAKNLKLILKGNRSICLGTQAYAFKFYRSVKELIYVGNDASGFSTAAEYWHPTLNKGDYEIGHNLA